ncbi:hypothetical protein PM082_007381 [Marasmius tenuissimus]|nr:hypothetical protein PM082_007381 [Marasmius tenuissimus]
MCSYNTTKKYLRQTASICSIFIHIPLRGCHGGTMWTVASLHADRPPRTKFRCHGGMYATPVIWSLHK